MNLQQAVDNEAYIWAGVWQEGVSGQEPRWPSTMNTDLPALAVRSFRDACMTFSCAVGLGWDKMHPRAIVRCSDCVIQAFISLFLLAECSGKWCEAVGVILVVLIPKSDGGRRPIGLFPTLIRIWMRCRLEIAQAWVASHDGSFFYAGPCKGADVAAWKQSLLAEASHSMRLPYISTLYCFVSLGESP